MKPYNQKEKDLIRKAYAKGNLKELAHFLGRSYEGICHKARSMGERRQIRAKPTYYAKRKGVIPVNQIPQRTIKQYQGIWRIKIGNQWVRALSFLYQEKFGKLPGNTYSYELINPEGPIEAGNIRAVHRAEQLRKVDREKNRQSILKNNKARREKAKRQALISTLGLSWGGAKPTVATTHTKALPRKTADYDLVA